MTQEKSMFAKTTSTLAIVAAAGALLAAPALAQTRTNIQIAGSSTVLPFASIVAEEFGQAFPEFETPVVASGGSSGGLRQFCTGVGPETIDIANASRPIRSSEIETCAANGVTDIRQIQIGYDGIVFASDVNGPEFSLEPRHVYLAIGANLPEGMAQPTMWNEIDPALPAQRIMMAIPASNHGTREVFVEKVIDAGCHAVMPEGTDADTCGALRQDNVVEIAGDYTETLARLAADHDTVGVFGLSFYEQNRDTLRVATMSGVTPSLEPWPRAIPGLAPAVLLRERRAYRRRPGHRGIRAVLPVGRHGRHGWPSGSRGHDPGPGGRDRSGSRELHERRQRRPVTAPVDPWRPGSLRGAASMSRR
jgi:phosphate ABC transporter substrate-binding protein, PhoT family (TC 3.A.1.7.1)